jgi:hypothetical protein
MMFRAAAGMVPTVLFCKKPKKPRKVSKSVPWYKSTTRKTKSLLKKWTCVAPLIKSATLTGPTTITQHDENASVLSGCFE